jgi:probable HAF family extracellular repeat protein
MKTVKNLNKAGLNKVGMVGVLGLLCSSFAFSQAVFSIVKVPGSSPNSAIAINNSGQVVVNGTANNSYEVSTWNRVNGANALGLTGINNDGTSINLSGNVAGVGDPNNDGYIQAFLWQSATGAQWLGSLGGNLSAATGINNSNAVVGLSYNAAKTQHAFLWTQAGGMQDLTADITSVGGGTAAAINSSNQVVGYYFPNGTRKSVGFTWTQAGGRHDIGSAGTLAYAVNDAGTVVGQTTLTTGYRHAFTWTQAGGLSDLGTLGGAESFALSVNNHGWIVGTSLAPTSKGLLHGFLWTPTAGMKDFTVLAGLSTGQQPYSVQVNDAGVIAISTNKGSSLLVPKMTATFTSSVNPSHVGQAVTFTATISSIAGAPPDGDTVKFSASGQVLGTATLHGGIAQFTTSTLTSGSHPVTATYNGDVNYLPTSYNALTQVVQ